MLYFKMAMLVYQRIWHIKIPLITLAWPILVTILLEMVYQRTKMGNVQ